MSKKVIAGGLAAVAVTGLVCGGLILATLRSSDREIYGMEQTTETEEMKTSRSEENVAGAEPEAKPEPEAKSDQETGQETEAETAPEREALSLTVDTDPEIYTYDQMAGDLQALTVNYPELAALDSLGETPDGRQIWHLVIGSPGAEKQVLVTATIHAREYMTTQLVMKQASEFLREASRDPALIQGAAIHVVPMINPDGAAISQMGLDGCQKEETRNRVLEIAKLDGASELGSYLRRWKANAQGIDVNRNFDALWESYEGAGHPSADHYKGEDIGCAPEARALIDLTENYAFDRTVSYHTQGNVIYWYFGQTGQLRTDTENLAAAVGAATGYPLDANYEQLDPAGYKDWAILKKGIPSLTIEVGRETSPVPPSQFWEIWQANREVWKILLNYNK